MLYLFNVCLSICVCMCERVQYLTIIAQALIPESWVDEKGKFNRWIRIKQQKGNVKCMSLTPLCNTQGDDYWKCYSAPYPWWIDLGSPVFNVKPCSWESPTKLGSCAKNSDPETKLCTIKLPPSMTCEPTGRFMHTLTASNFKNGKMAAILYGGMCVYVCAYVFHR